MPRKLAGCSLYKVTALDALNKLSAASHRLAQKVE
jgi:hypothetical protein